MRFEMAYDREDGCWRPGILRGPDKNGEGRRAWNLSADKSLFLPWKTAAAFQVKSAFTGCGVHQPQQLSLKAV